MSSNENMKALQVYAKIGAKSSGGLQVYKRNKACLDRYFGIDNVLEYGVKRKGGRYSITKITGPLFYLHFCGINKEDKENIVRIIEEGHVKLVFVESSLFGSLVDYIKKISPEVKIVTYFHNVEYDFQRSQMTWLQWLLVGWQNPLIKKSELLALRHSDACIVLHNRDNERLSSLYGCKAKYEIPITLKDVPLFCQPDTEYHVPIRLLFFGSNFPSNVDAVDILVNQIMPRVNAEMRIAGNGMDRLKGKYNNSRLSIEGYVNDLEEMYDWADLVVLPIFTGAGMKVKVAEALQFGKNIVASSDSLIGYEIDNLSGILSCNNIDDIVTNINDFDKSLPRYNVQGRKLFEKKYSYDASYQAYDRIFNEILK